MRQNSIFYEFLLLGKRYELLLPFFLGSVFLPLCVLPFLPGWEPSKWLLLYLITSASLIFFNYRNTFFVPRLTLFQKYILYLLLFVSLFNFFYHRVSPFEKESTDRILFWVMFFYYCSSLKFLNVPDKKYLFIPLFIATGIFIACAFLNFIFFDGFLASSFHNINKSAEFVGFSVALQMGFLSQYKDRLYNFILLLISSSIVYIYFTKCRSVSLGIIFVIAYLVWAKKMSLKSLIFILLGACFLGGFFEIVFHYLGVFPTDLSYKWGSTVERWHLILNTFSLFLDFPLGVGLGRYAFASIPYMKDLPNNAFNEGYFIFSPYNEPLRFLVEDGFIVCTLLFLFLSSFVFPFQKLKKISETCPEAIAFLIFFISQSFFQFPLIQPFPLFLIPFVLALTVFHTHELRPIKVPFFQWIGRSIGLYSCFFGVVFVSSLFIAVNFIHDIKLNKIIYRFWKDKKIMENILFSTYVDGDYEETQKYALEALKNEPQNLFAIKYLGLSTLFLGNKKLGCFYLIKYDAAYPDPSSVSEQIKKYCETP